jgi:hypothetical protein
MILVNVAGPVECNPPRGQSDIVVVGFTHPTGQPHYSSPAMIARNVSIPSPFSELVTTSSG